MKPKINTILIIEDDPGLIELINEKVQECGHPTICFQTAATAFEWLKNNTPILMMLDYSLPDMNAQEFIGELKSRYETVAPFIVATGQGDERIAVKMMKLGAKEYIIKDTHFLEMVPLIVSKSISEIERGNKLLLTEQKIVELSQFNKQIIESVHEGIIVYDKDLNYLTWNPFMEKITGIPAIDVIGKNAIELFPFLQDSGEAVNIKRAIEEKKITENEFEFNVAGTGKSGWASQTSGPLFNFEGEVIGAIATIHDVTKRKKAEEDLRFSEEKFRSITEQIDDYISICDINGIIFYASPAAKAMFRCESDEITGHHFMDFIDEEYLQKAVDAFQNGIKKKKKAVNLELKLKRKDGSTFFGELNGSKIEFGNEPRILVVVRDISERKKAEIALELTKQSYVDIINSVSEAIYVLDENAIFIDVNEGAREMYQLSNEELIGKTPADIAAPGLNNLKHVQKSLQNVFNTGIPATFEFWAVRKNGDIFPKEVIVNKGRYFEKDVLVATARDITERKAAQHEIDKIGKHYQALIENAPDGIVLISAEGQFKYASPSARKLFGYTATEELTENPNELTHPDDLDRVMFNLSKLFTDPTYVPTIEYRFIDKAGNWKWVETTFTNLLADPNVSSIVLNFKEITERKRAENALLTSETRLRKALAQSSGMIQSNNDEIDYQLIADSFLEISGAKYLSFNIFNDNGLDFTTVAVSGIKENLLKFTSIIGYEVINKKWKYDPIRAPRMEEKMISIFKSLSELTSTVIPKPISLLLEKTFNIGEVAIVKITKNNTAVGDFTLVYPKGETLENPELIELFANQVGLFVERKKAEKALNESEVLYRNLVQRIPDGVYKSTPDGRFVDVNPAMVKMFGYTNKDELLNLDINNELYFDENHRETVMLNTINEEITIFQLRKKDGSNIWVEDHGWYNFDENGRKTSNEGVLRDITERKKAEESLTEKMDELMRFHRLMVGRELTMIELKKEINNLLRKAGEVEKYKIVE